MKKNEIERLTTYFLEENEIDTSLDYEILSVPARSLICADRFDLMAKWIYIDAREKGMDMEKALEIYRDNINSFSCGLYFEPGTAEKNSFQKYIEVFDKLIDDIKKDGFNDNISLIPVDKNNRIFDGSHRVAAAAYYNKDVSVIKFPDKIPVYKYNYKYFKKYIMNENNMSIMAINYTYIKENCYFVCIWPSADRDKLSKAEDILSGYGDIVYSKEVYLNYNGIRNFMTQIYRGEKWLGSFDDKFSGANYKADPCVNKNNPVVTYILEANSLETVVEAKAKIRDVFALGKHSIHISNHKAEACEMAELLYNPNSVDFLNYADPFKYGTLFYKLPELKAAIEKRNLDKNRFIIDSSGVLEVCGLREAKDVDFLTDYDCRKNQAEDISDLVSDIDNHESQLKYHSLTVKDMLYNPQNYFYFHDTKFLSIYRLKQMKQTRNEEKDIEDVKLCNKFIEKFKQTPREYNSGIVDEINKYQKENKDYGNGALSYREYKKRLFKKRFSFLKKPLYLFSKICTKLRGGWSPDKVNLYRRNLWIKSQRRRLRNKNVSIISSNCNGGVLSSDLGLGFNSPFVNLFIKASDYINILNDLKGYMSEELRFVKEYDSIYGNVSYPTAYLRDAKIYFMHYLTEDEARSACERRRERINWDNLYILFTDRSQCSEDDLRNFDKLPFEHKIVFTHIPHPEIKSSFYIKGYENEDKVPILTSFQDEKTKIKRIYDQFDMVGWLNGDIG